MGATSLRLGHGPERVCPRVSWREAMMGFVLAAIIGGCVAGLMHLHEREAKTKATRAKARRIEQCACGSRRHA